MTHDERMWLMMLAELADDELAETAERYIWLAEFGPMGRRYIFELKRNSVVAECDRRGRWDLVRAARAKWGARSA